MNVHISHLTSYLHEPKTLIKHNFFIVLKSFGYCKSLLCAYCGINICDIAVLSVYLVGNK